MIRPLNPKAKTILKVGAVLAIITFILFIWANVRPVPIRVQITFTGFTNYTTTNGAFRGLANFCVSNAGKCSVIDEVGYYYETEKKKPLITSVVEGKWNTFELKPGEFKTISLMTPETSEPWRVSLCFSKADWRYRLVQRLSQAPPWVVGMFKRFFPLRLLVRRAWDCYSDWVYGNPNPIKPAPSLP